MLLLFLVLSIPAAIASTFYSNSTPQTWELPTPPLAFAPQTFELNGTLGIPEPPHACAPLSNNLTGLVALVESDKCAPYVKVENCLAAGAIAVVLRGYRDTFGLLYYYRSQKDKDVAVPVVEISGDLDLSENPHGYDNVTLVPAPNPITEFGQGPWTFYTIVFTLFIVVTAVLAARKFVLFQNRVTEKEKYALPRFTTILIMFTCVIRTVILIDPTGTRNVHTWSIIELFLTLDFGFALAAALFVAVHWDAMVRKIEKSDNSHKKLKNVGFVVCAVLVVVEIVTSILRALFFPAMPFLMTKVILYCITGFTVGGYFLWSGIKVLKLSKELGGKVPDSLRRKAKFGIVIAVCLILFPITAFLVATPMYDPAGGYFMLRFLASLWLNIVTLFLGFLFDAKKSSESTQKEGSAWVETAAGSSVGTEPSLEMNVDEESSAT